MRNMFVTNHALDRLLENGRGVFEFYGYSIDELRKMSRDSVRYLFLKSCRESLRRISGNKYCTGGIVFTLISVGKYKKVVTVLGSYEYFFWNRRDRHRSFVKTRQVI